MIFWHFYFNSNRINIYFRLTFVITIGDFVELLQECTYGLYLTTDPRTSAGLVDV